MTRSKKIINKRIQEKVELVLKEFFSFPFFRVSACRCIRVCVFGFILRLPRHRCTCTQYHVLCIYSVYSIVYTVFRRVIVVAGIETSKEKVVDERRGGVHDRFSGNNRGKNFNLVLFLFFFLGNFVTKRRTGHFSLWLYVEKVSKKIVHTMDSKHSKHAFPFRYNHRAQSLGWFI